MGASLLKECEMPKRVRRRVRRGPNGGRGRLGKKERRWKRFMKAVFAFLYVKERVWVRSQYLMQYYRVRWLPRVLGREPPPLEDAAEEEEEEGN